MGLYSVNTEHYLHYNTILKSIFSAVINLLTTSISTSDF